MAHLALKMGEVGRTNLCLSLCVLCSHSCCVFLSRPFGEVWPLRSLCSRVVIVSGKMLSFSWWKLKGGSGVGRGDPVCRDTSDSLLFVCLSVNRIFEEYLTLSKTNTICHWLELPLSTKVGYNISMEGHEHSESTALLFCWKLNPAKGHVSHKEMSFHILTHTHTQIYLYIYSHTPSTWRMVYFTTAYISERAEMRVKNLHHLVSSVAEEAQKSADSII